MSTLKNFSITFLFFEGLILFCSVMHIMCSNAKFKYWSKMAFFWPSLKCDLRFLMMALYENKLPSSWPSKHGHVCFKRFHAESSNVAQDYQNQIFFSFFLFSFFKNNFLSTNQCGCVCIETNYVTNQVIDGKCPLCEVSLEHLMLSMVKSPLLQ